MARVGRACVRACLTTPSFKQRKGQQGPDPNSKPGCCFNYWWNDDDADHGITNLTEASPDDDAVYNADSFIRFAEAQAGAPFL